MGDTFINFVWIRAGSIIITKVLSFHTFYVFAILFITLIKNTDNHFFLKRYESIIEIKFIN